MQAAFNREVKRFVDGSSEFSLNSLRNYVQNGARARIARQPGMTIIVQRHPRSGRARIGGEVAARIMREAAHPAGMRY
jgi:hypothetical protein